MPLSRDAIVLFFRQCFNVWTEVGKLEVLVNGGYCDASKMGRNERNGLIFQAAKEKVCSARRISLWEYCEVLGVAMGRSILIQQDQKLASGGVCGVLV